MRRSVRWPSALVVLALVAAACSDSSFFDSYATDTTVTTTTVVATTVPPILDPSAPIPTVDTPTPNPTALPVDPDVRIGRLDNGLTYYLRSNDSPGTNLDLRLVVNAGSAQQVTPDAGTAHFLEHMLFNGTENFPANELTNSLERLGIQFGADTNAFTSYDETVYLLGATTADRGTVEVAFDVLAEWAFAATIQPAAVADEIGVVRDEMRQGRESADGMIFDQFEQMYTAGSSYEGFGVLGTAEQIDSTTAPPLRDFYDRWYRPDNMAVIVVGDMSIDSMLKAVTERFADLVPRSDSPPPPTASVDISTSATGHVFTNPDNAVDNISIDIPLTAWDESTVGGQRLSLMESIIAVMVDNLLNDGFQNGIIHTSTAPFFSRFQINRGLHYAGTNIQANDLELALADLIGQFKGAAARGFTAADLGRATDELRPQLDSVLLGADSRQDAQYADDYMFHFLSGADIDTTESRTERLLAILDSLTPADVTNHWRWILQTGGPIIAAVGSDPSSLPTSQRLVEIADTAPPYIGDESLAEPLIDTLMARPDAVDPVSSDSRRGFDGPIEEWKFANGVTVVFQPSKISEGQVGLTTASEGGWSVLPDGTSAVIDLIMSAVSNSGLAAFSSSQLDRYLAGTTASLFPYVDTTTEGFFGSSSADDIEVLFQLLSLMATSARIDDPAFNEAITFGRNQIAVASTDPQVQATAAQVDARTGSSPSFQIIPDAQQLDDLTPASALTIYNSRLGKIDQPIVVLVGDADPDVVRDLAGRYLGTLPAGPHDSWVDNLPPMPGGITTSNVQLNPGVNTGGIAILYSTELDVTAKLDAAAHVLETIVSSRIIETVREELGASYGGIATAASFYAPDERIDATIRIDGDPDRVDEIRSVMLEQIADLSANGPTDDEFSRAISIIDADYQFVDDQLFANSILTSHLFPNETVLSSENRLELLHSLTRSDIRDLAQRVFPSDQRIEVTRTSG